MTFRFRAAFSSARASLRRATAAVRHRVAAQSAHRRDRRRLEAELAQYASAGDRADLGRILDRYPPAATAEIRAILSSQSAEPPAWPLRVG